MGWNLQRAVILGVAALALACPSAARSQDDDDDHDLARDLHEGGEIRALSEVLNDISRSTQGEVVAVNLVRTSSGWTYRIQIVTPDGRRSLVEVDAGKGTALHDKGHD